MRSLASETPGMIGETVTMKGWVLARRDHGKIMFLDLRDRSGVVQTVGAKSMGDARAEDVVEVVGLVKKRPEAMINPKITTGEIEVELRELRVISKAKELPFPIDSSGYEINEEIRTKYRYLDLRRPRMAHNIRLRSKVVGFIRNFLLEKDFVEIETPVLTKTTPEGARDFLVPSRLQQGKFYALPQSPQQYKQLLMVAGMERYFQIARCFRDEDPRRDRAYGEFTQLDMEMSFVTQDDIILLAEELFTAVVKDLFPNKHMTQSPWPRISHKEVMEKYGTDKPDLRKDKNDPDELAFSWTIDFPLFNEQKDDDFFFGSGKAKFAPSHHMFTAPHPDDIPLLDTDPMKVRGLQHDLVLNGFEVGGGSVRIHQPEVQSKVFDLIGFSDAQKEEFAHMLTAFGFGVPPHGGIAPGIDRFLMAVLGEPSVREVMAFPTSASGTTSVMDAPSSAAPEQLTELGIAVKSVHKAKPADGNAVYARIADEIKSAGIDFEPYTHEAVHTSEEAAKVRNTPLSEGAKALLLFADGKPIMVVIPGNRKLDMKSFKSLYHIRDLRMATPEEVESVTGVTIGAVPPFGKIFGIPLYMDTSVRHNSHVSFNAGLHTHSMRMSESGYEKVANPVAGEFSKDA